MPTFSERLRRLMRERGETTRSLGAAVGASSGAVTGWMNGASPRPDAMKRLAAHFGVSVEDLVGPAGSYPQGASDFLEEEASHLLEEGQPERELVAAPIKTAAALAKRSHGLDQAAGQTAFERHLQNLRSMRFEAERLHPRDAAAAALHMDALIASYISAMEAVGK